LPERRDIENSASLWSQQIHSVIARSIQIEFAHPSRLLTLFNSALKTGDLNVGSMPFNFSDGNPVDLFLASELESFRTNAAASSVTAIYFGLEDGRAFGAFYEGKGNITFQGVNISGTDTEFDGCLVRFARSPGGRVLVGDASRISCPVDVTNRYDCFPLLLNGFVVFLSLFLAISSFFVISFFHPIFICSC
jgi:hypothetical protein